MSKTIILWNAMWTIKCKWKMKSIRVKCNKKCVWFVLIIYLHQHFIQFLLITLSTRLYPLPLSLSSTSLLVFICLIISVSLNTNSNSLSPIKTTFLSVLNAIDFLIYISTYILSPMYTPILLF